MEVPSNVPSRHEILVLIKDKILEYKQRNEIEKLSFAQVSSSVKMISKVVLLFALLAIAFGTR